MTFKEAFEKFFHINVGAEEWIRNCEWTAKFISKEKAYCEFYSSFPTKESYDQIVGNYYNVIIALERFDNPESVDDYNQDELNDTFLLITSGEELLDLYRNTLDKMTSGGLSGFEVETVRAKLALQKILKPCF